MKTLPLYYVESGTSNVLALEEMFEDEGLGGPDFVVLENPSLEQRRVLEAAIELSNVSLYYQHQLLKAGYTIYHHSVAEHARKDAFSQGYICLKHGRFMESKTLTAMLNLVFDLPPLSSLCVDEHDPHYEVFKGVLNAMIDFLSVGRVPEESCFGDDFPDDIPF